VASFTVACNRRFSGQNQDQSADFINCVAWRQTADFMAQYAAKGSLVGIEGRIQSRSYDDASGKRVYVTEVVADSVQLLESKAQTASHRAEPNYAAPQNNYSNSYANTNSYAQPQNTGYEPDYGFDGFGAGPTLDISSDDLPF
jgi:single-strand DNA-binding protein